MNKYKVRIEIKVNAIDLAEIEVEACCINEAKYLAIKAYEEDSSQVDTWQSDGTEYNIDFNQVDDWLVEKLE